MATLVMASELILILVSAMVSGVSYHLIAYSDPGPMQTFAAIGGLAALFYVLPFLSQGRSDVAAYMSGRRSFSYVLLRWHASLMLLGVVGFLTKSTAMFSRGWMVIFYLAGIVLLGFLNALTGRLVRSGIEQRRVAPRRLMLVGTNEDIARFWARRGHDNQLDQIVSIVRLPQAGATRDAEVAESLVSAVSHARLYCVDAVLILPGQITTPIIGTCVDALSVLPVSIHLDAGPALDKVVPTEIERIGNVAALTLARKPLGPLQAVIKRAFDIVAALAGLVMLAPVFAIVAAWIKLDSKGPVLFLQRRRGYNHQEFRIAKFRSMSTLDDGDTVVQAKADDVRITRAGRVIRKLNIDELPQLWNVLVGEMSIVGPRPHAVAHDKRFETRIDDYPRRLNVKPGITGWAQVNGLRGETETDDKMSKRVQHDLYYIDHWSLWLDIKIVWLTVLSRRAFSNAR